MVYLKGPGDNLAVSDGRRVEQSQRRPLRKQGEMRIKMKEQVHM